MAEGSTERLGGLGRATADLAFTDPAISPPLLV